MHDMFRSIHPGELVFDIGAHLGHYSELFLACGARVIAVEPQPNMLAVLQQRFAGNPSVTIIPKGLGEAPGILTMHINSQSPDVSTFDPGVMKLDRWKDKVWDSEVSVDITTLDKLIDEFGIPKFAKIDVEGFEKRVMLGLSRKIASLSIEFVPENLLETRDILWYARGLGFKEFNVGLGTETNFFIPGWVSVDEVLVHLARFGQENPMIWGDVYAR